MTKLHQLADLGQAIWLDDIRRSAIKSGELQVWIARGLRGVTSNPSIFQKAIAGNTDSPICCVPSMTRQMGWMDT